MIVAVIFLCHHLFIQKLHQTAIVAVAPTGSECSHSMPLILF